MLAARRAVAPTLRLISQQPAFLTRTMSIKVRRWRCVGVEDLVSPLLSLTFALACVVHRVA